MGVAAPRDLSSGDYFLRTQCWSRFVPCVGSAITSAATPLSYQGPLNVITVIVGNSTSPRTRYSCCGPVFHLIVITMFESNDTALPLFAAADIRMDAVSAAAEA